MKVDLMKEILKKVHEGFKGELLYSYRSGVYEVTLQRADGSDAKTYKIPRGMYDPNDLKDAVYGTTYSKKKT